MSEPIDVLLKDIDRCQAMLKEQNAEIERLKEKYDKLKRLYDAKVNIVSKFQEAYDSDKQLIIELADALQSWAGTPGVSKDNFAREHRNLIQRAREASK